MKIIEQSWEWIKKPDHALERIERAGRTCYKSEEKTGFTAESGQKFAKMLLKRGHNTVLEHVSASVRLITNRGVTHELVRHRLCSFSQESTRYVRYDGTMEFIRPVWWDEWSEYEKVIFNRSCEKSEHGYMALLSQGSRPEQAREVLPNSLKTEIVVTANLRQWRHIFNLRCAKQAHPQIRFLMRSVLKGFHEAVPVIFADLHKRYILKEDS